MALESEESVSAARGWGGSPFTPHVPRALAASSLRFPVGKGLLGPRVSPRPLLLNPAPCPALPAWLWGSGYVHFWHGPVAPRGVGCPLLLPCSSPSSLPAAPSSSISTKTPLCPLSPSCIVPSARLLAQAGARCPVPGASAAETSPGQLGTDPSPRGDSAEPGRRGSPFLLLPPNFPSPAAALQRGPGPVRGAFRTEGSRQLLFIESSSAGRTLH